MVVKTHEEAISMLGSIDAALDRFVSKGIENAFIIAGSHNDLLSVIEYLKTDVKRANASQPTPETEKE